MRSNRDFPYRAIGSMVLLLGMMAAAPRMSAQRYSQEHVNATALINLAGFIEWPRGVIQPPPAPVTFCTLGEGGTVAELERSSHSQKVNLHDIAVRTMQGPQDVAGCHLIFLTAGAAKHQQKVIESAKGLPVALVSEIAGFARKGGTVNFSNVNGRIILDVNQKSAEAANLKINARILMMSTIVRSGGPEDGKE
jgi:hypothetical protein